MARRMAGVGRVTVSLRRSIIGKQHAAPAQPEAPAFALEQAVIQEAANGPFVPAPLRGLGLDPLDQPQAHEKSLFLQARGR